MDRNRVGRKQGVAFAIWLVMAVFAFSVQAAPVDVTHSRALVPAGALDSDGADDAPATAGAVAADAANNGVPAGTANTRAASSTASGFPVVQAAPAREVASSAKTLDVDLRRALRDVAKPVLDDLSHSAVVEAVRGLAGDPSAANVDFTDDGLATVERRRQWNDQQPSGGEAEGGNSGQQARTETERATEKIKASLLLEALLKEVAPWAIAAVVLYGLFHVARLVFALRRRIKANRRQRHMSDRHRRRSSSRRSSRSLSSSSSNRGSSGHRSRGMSARH